MIGQFGLRKEIYFSLDELNKRLKDFEDLQVGKDYSLYEEWISGFNQASEFNTAFVTEYEVGKIYE